MNKAFYFMLVVVFAVSTNVARLWVFDGNSYWSYIMGMIFSILCSTAYKFIVEGRYK